MSKPMYDHGDATRYRQARVLCGGEDPVEALGRIAEATGYARALQAERASNPEEDQHFLLSEHVADRLRDSEARDSLLDLVQRLLDDLIDYDAENDNGKRLIEEARAKVAELRKGGDG